MLYEQVCQPLTAPVKGIYFKKYVCENGCFIQKQKWRKIEIPQILHQTEENGRRGVGEKLRLTFTVTRNV